ncbi:MAG: phosphodiester glycosidase family protein [Elusimicrobiota bacterium]
MIILLLVFLLCFPSTAHSAWTQIAPGIDYQKFTVTGPNIIFVSRMLRSQANLKLGAMIGTGEIRSGAETVSKMVTRYEDTINHKGERYHIIAAINGGYFLSNGTVKDGMMLDGTYIDRIDYWAGGQRSFIYNHDKTMFVDHISSGTQLLYTSSGKVTFADNSTATISNQNTVRSTNQLILYTCHYDTATFTGIYGTEVIVGNVTTPLRANTEVSGIVKEVRLSGKSSAPIPYDGFVLSGHGTASTLLSTKCHIGDTIKIKLSITPSTTYHAGNDFSNVDFITGGYGWILRNGNISDSQLSPNPQPRTVIAWNDTYIYFVVNDGRTSISIGMTLQQISQFLINSLQAKEAMNCDGGGSSTFWLDGSMRNDPSDTTGERNVGNGLMMAYVTTDKSSKFVTGDIIVSTANTRLYLGPGTNFGYLGYTSSSTNSTILTHPINGIYTKGIYWWKIKYSSLEGWVPEYMLKLFSAPAAVPDTPTGLTGVALSSTSVQISWTDNSDNETGFKVERKPENGLYTEVVVISSNTVRYNNNGLSSSSTYYYRVYAYNITGNSGYSNEIKLVALPPSNATENPPLTPTGLTGIVLSSTAAQVSWTDNSDNETNFRLERKRIDQNNYQEIAVISSNTASYIDSGLTAGTTYSYRVKAVNGSASSAYSNETVLLVNSISGEDTVPPYNPTWTRCWNNSTRDIEFNNGTSENITSMPYFEWGDAIDMDTGVSGYTIYWGTNSTADPGYNQDIPHTTVNSYEITESMTANLPYYLRICTWDIANNRSGSKTLFKLKYDTVNPIINKITLNTSTFSPDGDGQQDSISVAYTLNEDCYVTIKILDSNKNVVKVIESDNLKPAGINSFEWDGNNSTGQLVSDDSYSYNINLFDLANNQGTTYSGTFEKQAASGEELRPKEKVLLIGNTNSGNKILFKGIQNTNVKINIFTLSGIKIRELSNSDNWDGTNDSGSYVPSGIYIYQYQYKDKKFQGTITVVR